MSHCHSHQNRSSIFGRAYRHPWSPREFRKPIYDIAVLGTWSCRSEELQHNCGWTLDVPRAAIVHGKQKRLYFIIVSAPRQLRAVTMAEPRHHIP